MSASPSKPRGGSRLAAVRAILDWQEGRSPSIAEALSVSHLSVADAGLARELADGAVAWGRLYRALAQRFLRPGRQPAELLAVLAVTAHQLFALDRIPPHAAVAEGVEALRQLGHPHLTGVANAVSRRLAALRCDVRHGDGPCGRLRGEDQPSGLADRLSLPDLLIEHLKPVLPGVASQEQELAALTHLPPLCTRSRPGSPQAVGASIVRRDGPWTWWDDPAQALGWVTDGMAVVQDRSQGAAIDLARVRPGELVLDLCAAPGGKSLACVDLGARVVAADRMPGKVADLASVVPGRAMVQDGTRPALGPAFDLVIVDAPCSNSGVLARRVEARWRYDAAHLASLATLQAALIRCGADLVAPGGRLLYSTCSLAPCENQGVAHRLDGWRVLAEHLSWPDRWQLGGYACLLVRA